MSFKNRTIFTPLNAFYNCVNNKQNSLNEQLIYRIMKRMLFLSAIIFAAVALVSCKEENKIEIPKSLEQSTWSSVINPDTFEQTRVEFTSAGNATYTILTRGYGTDDTKLRAEYTYTYNQPDITLTPKSDDAPALKGMFKNHGDSYIVLYLTSSESDLELNLTQVVDKDQTIWE